VPGDELDGAAEDLGCVVVEGGHVVAVVEHPLRDVRRRHPLGDQLGAQRLDDMVLDRAVDDEWRDDLRQIVAGHPPERTQRVEGAERGAVVAVLVATGALDVVADAGDRRHHPFEHRGQHQPPVGGRHRRVDEEEPGHLRGPLLGEAQREAPAHGQPGHEDLCTGVAQVGQGPCGLAVPVMPRGRIHLLPRGAVAGEPGDAYGHALGGEVLPPGTHGGRRAGEPVQQQHSRVTALGGEGLGGGGNRH
jgi:hypothetical protein